MQGSSNVDGGSGLPLSPDYAPSADGRNGLLARGRLLPCTGA